MKLSELFEARSINWTKESEVPELAKLAGLYYKHMGVDYGDTNKPKFIISMAPIPQGQFYENILKVPSWWVIQIDFNSYYIKGTLKPKEARSNPNDDMERWSTRVLEDLGFTINNGDILCL